MKVADDTTQLRAFIYADTGTIGRNMGRGITIDKGNFMFGCFTQRYDKEQRKI